MPDMAPFYRLTPSWTDCMPDHKAETGARAVGGVGSRIDRLIARVALWFARLGGVMILLIAVIVCGDIAARNLLNTVVFNSFEYSIYLFAAAVAFGFSHALVTRANIRIDVAYLLFPRPVRRAVDFLALVCLAAVGILFAYKAWGLAIENAVRGVASNSVLAVPLALPQSFWALGLTAFAVTAILLLLRHAFLALSGRGSAADALAGVAHEAESELADRDRPGADAEAGR